MYLLFNLDVGTLIHLLYTLRSPAYGGDPTLFNTENAFFIPLAVYFTVTGFMQILTSLLMLLAIKECLGKDSRSCVTKLLLTFLLFTFGLNIGYGAITGMNVTAYNEIWLNCHSFLDVTGGELFNSVMIYAKYTLAEAVIAFALTFPMTIIALSAILTPIINLEDGYNPYSEKYALADQMN